MNTISRTERIERERTNYATPKTFVSSPPPQDQCQEIVWNTDDRKPTETLYEYILRTR